MRQKIPVKNNSGCLASSPLHRDHRCSEPPPAAYSRNSVVVADPIRVGKVELIKILPINEMLSANTIWKIFFVA